MRVLRNQIVGLMIVFLVPSCSRAETMANEMDSTLHSALSLASETELFIQQIEGGRLLTHFQAAHADYLRAEAKRDAREARDSARKAHNAAIFVLCAKQLESLSAQLQVIGAHRDPKTIAEAQGRVEVIRQRLLAASAGR
jgi:hypothetical protein